MIYMPTDGFVWCLGSLRENTREAVHTDLGCMAFLINAVNINMRMTLTGNRLVNEFCSHIFSDFLPISYIMTLLEWIVIPDRRLSFK